ncbi:MAG: restriction endonuclease subunit S [Paludibacter sp.]
MKQYSKYKPSGIDWLGEIPEHWEVKRVKEIGNVVLGKMLCGDPKQGYSLKPYLKSKNIGWIKVNTDSVEEMYFSDTELKQYKIKKGDLLLSEGGEVGKTCYWNNELDECYIQNSVHKITFPITANSRYFLYFSFTVGVSGGYDGIVNFISIKHLTYEKLNRVLWCVPPKSEQTLIVNYLDTKTTSIDRKIELLTSKADKYRALRRSIINQTVCRGLNPDVTLKDSGVEWIGEIPEHWEVKRMKDVAKATIGLTYSPEDIVDENEGILVLRSGNIQNGELSFNDNAYVNCSIPKNLMVRNGDVLLCARNGSANLVGKSAYIDNYMNFSWGAFMTVVRSRIGKYLFYVLNSDLLKSNMGLFQTSTVNQLTTKMLDNMDLPMTAHSEQTAITTYLDEKTSQLDTIITNITQQISKLTQLRKSLINDVVTGKIKVT